MSAVVKGFGCRQARLATSVFEGRADSRVAPPCLSTSGQTEATNERQLLNITARLVAFSGDERPVRSRLPITKYGTALCSKFFSIKSTVSIRARPLRQNGYVRKPVAPRLGFGGTSCFAELDSSRRSPIPTNGSIQRGSRLRPSGRPVSVNRPAGPADDVSS